jgi:hypothetical protein
MLTHDAGVSAFTDADGAADSDGDSVSFSWDEKHLVEVDAPADLEGAFDTSTFYKITDATIARPIKQLYVNDGEVNVYKKPAEELRKAAWSFDNVPFTLDHPATGMVQRVEDIHGFWRNARYDDADDRLLADLYVPSNDSDALSFIEDNQDVSVGFYKRVVDEYDGDTGDLTDDEVDGYQVDIYGNHVAGVERGRCNHEDGCGLDEAHGMSFDATTVFEQSENMTEEMFSEGDRVQWLADAVVAHNPDDESGIMIEIMADGESTEMVTTVPASSLQKMMEMDGGADNCGCNGTVDAPDGIYTEDDKWYGIAPSETADDEPKYELDNCSDVSDAWGLVGSGDYQIAESTLEARIKRAADAHDCSPEQRPWDEDNENMSNDEDKTDQFDITVEVDGTPTVDSLAEQFDAVADLRDERDEYEAALDERRETIDAAFDAAENVDIDLDEYDCRCDAVADALDTLDETVEEVDDLQDELNEYRAEELDERLDTLEELGADREKYADASLDAVEEEIERRKEVLDAVDDASVKDIDASTDSEDTDAERGRRSFGRGYSS